MRRRESRQKFEECWRALVNDYPILRKKKAFFYEADLQLHLAYRLMKKFQSTEVYQEYRLSPSEVTTGGRPLAKGIRFDLAIHPEDSEYPYIIVEIKWLPLYGIFEESLERYKKWLLRHRKLLGDEITKGIWNYYTGNIRYFYKYIEKTGAFGYLCIIDEWHDNIGKYLKDSLENGTPRKFKILAEHFNYHSL